MIDAGTPGSSKGSGSRLIGVVGTGTSCGSGAWSAACPKSPGGPAGCGMEALFGLTSSVVCGAPEPLIGTSSVGSGSPGPCSLSDSIGVVGS